MPSSLKNALIVDDDPIARELIAACFSAHAALAILPAGTAEEAVAIVEAQRVDLIIADLNMPDTDGVELLAALAQHAVHAPIVIVSGAAGPVIKAAAALAKARGLNILGALPKPVSRGELWPLVADAMAA